MMKVVPHSTRQVSTVRQSQEHNDSPPREGLGGATPGPSSHKPFQRSLGAPAKISPSRRVDHTYRDYSNIPPAELHPGKLPKNFPNKLHQILSTPEYSHIISWMPHGRAWKIHKKDLFVREIVPKYFMQAEHEFFTCQLIGWGFKQLYQSGNDYSAYYHECFMRGFAPLTVLMKRVAPSKCKILPHVEGEPNFYEIDEQFPLPAAVMACRMR